VTGHDASVARQAYIAILLNSSSSEAPGHQPLWQEETVLIHAVDEHEARRRAQRRGESGRTDFANAAGEVIRWRFEGVIDVAEVLESDLSGDADLYCRHFRNIEAYRAFEPLISGETL